MTQKPFDPKSDGAIVDFAKAMSYSDYLHLDPILSAQFPQSSAHDEMLFIVQHQTSELWMRLAIFEMQSLRGDIINRDIDPALKKLARVSRIFEQLNSAWDVLRTMTPSEYTQFRESLGQSSGFQSVQYRLIEFIAGNRNNAMIKAHEHRPDYVERLNDELQKPSLYQAAIALLAGHVDVPAHILSRDMSSAHVFDEGLMQAWAVVYRDPKKYWELYALAEKLVDFEDYFRRWRFNHLTTVSRIIGMKRGTGGTGGVSYLQRMLEVELFPELWQLRTIL